MKTFKDQQSQTHNLSVDFKSLELAKSQLDVDFLGRDADITEALTDLNDPLKLVPLIAICMQRETPDLTDEQCWQILRGVALDNATEAFINDLTDFIPSQKRRRVMHSLVEKLDALQDRALDLAAEKLESPEMEQAINDAIDDLGQKFESSATASPESSESIQTDSPTGNS